MNEFDQLTKQIATLAADMAAAGKAKTFVQQADDLNKALKSAREINWARLLPLMEESHGSAKADAESQLANRRQKMLETLKVRDVHYRVDGETDMVDVFKIRYKGVMTVIEFAGVEVASVDELDGEKLADEILAFRSRLGKSALDRKSVV